MALRYHLTIKDMQAEMRPRERLVQSGPQSLSDAELLAIVLGSGAAAMTALDLANRLLSELGGLRGLVGQDPFELQKVRGIGLAKAAQIKAAVELGRRLATLNGEQRPAVCSPTEAAALVMEEMRYLDREHFRALLLNTKNRLISIENISVGTLNSSSVHPRELFKTAIKKSAAALILVHNHPSGDPTPSKQDIKLTKKLVQVGDLVGIAVVDHVIIGDNRYVSLKAQGLLNCN